MTKFLNISTDTTLGGSSASDEVVSSQKALKTYIDNHGGGGGGAVDSVNGKTGVVVLDYSDVGALPDTTVIPTVDQTYSSTSSNAQSGTAVASAVSGKQATITGGATTITSNDLTSNRALVSNASGKVAVSSVTSTELGYVSGVTSAIQTQLNGKVSGNTSITGATKCKITYDSKGLVTSGANLSATDIPNLSLSKITDVTATASELNVLDGITATTTELNYVDGVTSSIQTQLNGKVASNTAITGATKCKITYDSKGLVTDGADLSSSDITTALGYTPYSSANPSGYTSNVGTVTSVNNVSPVNGNVTLSIPSEVTETTVSNWGFTKNTGTVTSVNNVSPVSGNVTLSIPTQASDIGAQPTLVSGTNIKTINNTTILGSGNINIESLPSQTGNSGKYLTTNGTNASWVIPKINNLFDFKWSDYELDDQSWLRGDTFSWQDGTVYSDAYNHLVDDYTTKAVGRKYIKRNSDTKIYFRYESYDDLTKSHPYAWVDESGAWEVYTNTENPTTSDYCYSTNSSSTSYAISEVGIETQRSETVGSYTITYVLSEDGHKIVLPDQEATVLNIYNESGVAWYYILDTTNTRFKLPRENPAREELLQVIRAKGNKMALGLTNGTNNAGLIFVSGGGFSPRNGSYGLTTDDTASTTGTWSSTTVVAMTQDSTKSGIISDLKDSTSVFKGKKYLYFYVGQFSQTATEQTAGLNAELFNGKVDLNGNNATFRRVIDSYKNGQSWYRVWSDGFCEQGGYVDRSGTTQTVSFYKVYSDANATVCITPYHTTASTDGRPPLINAVSTTGFTLNIYTSYTGAYWMACGYIT